MFKGFVGLIMAFLILVSQAQEGKWDIPYQTLFTPQGIQILFSKNHTEPKIKLYIGFKHAGIVKDSLKEQA